MWCFFRVTYQFLIHNLAPVDRGHALSPRLVVDLVVVFPQSLDAVTELVHAVSKTHNNIREDSNSNLLLSTYCASFD